MAERLCGRCGAWTGGRIIARREDGHFLFIRQYRKSHDKICLEAVAGNCDPGEEALLSAKRELREETGYQAQSILSWYDFTERGLLF